MELIHIEESRVVELLLASRPRSQLHLPSAVAKVRDAFAFARAPESLTDGGESGLRFFQGSYLDGAIEELSIYGDGIVLVSRSSTDFLVKALEHIKEWASEELGLRYFKTTEIDRLYQSQIIVRSSKNLLKALDALDPVRKSLEQELAKNSKMSAEFQPATLGFAVDPQKSLHKPSMFRLERKAGVDFDYGAYISAAPLTTDSHLMVLETLERLC